MKLLTEAKSNTKTAKNSKMGKYLSYILHLAPSNLSGANVCPMASKGCIATCLNTAGRGQFNSVQEARIRKTKMYVHDRSMFMNLLLKDLNAVERKAKKLGLKAVVRLNGTSDLDFTSIPLMFPKIQFYDYTKVLRRLKRDLPKNYHLTFSRSEVNETECVEALALGFNVAVVFRNMPQLASVAYLGKPLLNGDDHDLRFLDRSPGKFGAVIALKAKGKARKDASGFVVDL